jgi:hypothetical protein
MTRAGMPAPRADASTNPITKAAAPRAEQAHLCVTAPAICPASDRAEGTGCRQPVPTLSPPVTFACNCRIPGHRWQADPTRRAACGPSTGSGAAAPPFLMPQALQRATNCPCRRTWTVRWPGKSASVYEVCGLR